MKMSQTEALNLLGLPSVNEIYQQNLSVKKAYKVAALAAHPDRNGDKFQMAKINVAYTFLKSIVNPQSFEDFKVDRSRKDAFYAQNEGHELCGAGIPALKTREMLIREIFDIRDTLEEMPGISPMSEYEKNKAASSNAYFQYEGEDYHISWWGACTTDQMYISRITEAGKSGKVCPVLKFCVEDWAYDSCSQVISNIFRDLFKDSDYADGEPESGFSWGRVYDDVMAAIDNAVVVSENTKTTQLYGYTMIFRQERYDAKWTLDVEGNKVVLYVREYSSISTFNPFSFDVYKPLKSMPTKFKVLDLIKVLMNGQYADFKRDYMHTDDYAWDNACGSGERYIENPFKAIKDWIEHRGRKGGAQVYINGDCQISFGFHLNDSSSLTVVINNRFSLVDLSENVKYIGEQARLVA